MRQLEIEERAEARAEQRQERRDAKAFADRAHDLDADDGDRDDCLAHRARLLRETGRFTNIQLRSEALRNVRACK